MAAAALEASLAPCTEACEKAAEEGLLTQQPELALGIESDDGATSAGPAEEPGARSLGRLRRPRAAVAAAVGAALLLGCVAVGAAGLRGWGRQAPEWSNVDDAMALSALDSFVGVMGTFADGVHEAATLSDNVEESYKAAREVTGTFKTSAKKFEGIGGKLFHALEAGPKKRKALMAKFKALNATQKAKVKAKLFKRFNISSWKELRPKAHLNDGNLCSDDEEQHGSLCYAKCAALTNGDFPFRVSAWECCAKPGPCSENFKIDIGMCSGFSKSGQQAGGGCPHTKGACLKSEEFYGNYCYKRCALLNHNILTERAGPSTCCKPGHGNSIFAFIDTDVCDTQAAFAVGGGKGDDDPDTPHQPHLPMESLTEKQD